MVLVTGKDVLASKTLQEVFPIGRMMWGKLLGYDWWPGYIVSHSQDAPKREIGGEEDNGGDADQKLWLKWFGETQLSYVSEVGVFLSQHLFSIGHMGKAWMFICLFVLLRSWLWTS